MILAAATVAASTDMNSAVAASAPYAASSSEAGSGQKQYEVRIPPADEAGSGKFLSAKNFAIIAMTLAFVYLTIVLVQVCTKSRDARRNSNSERESELTEELISRQEGDSLSYTYYYDEEEQYTNSQYLRSDDQNSLVDHKHFKYDQSLKDSHSRVPSETGSESAGMMDNHDSARGGKLGGAGGHKLFAKGALKIVH